MPKLKTHSGAKKRFKVTKSGKVKFKMPGLRHLLTGMKPSRGRKLRRATTLSATDNKIIKKFMPYAF